MNLHAIASRYVSAVNPMADGQWKQSTGYTTAGDGTRTPSYADPVDIKAQLQPMGYKDLVQVEGLNLGGEKRAMYVNQDIHAVMRPDGQGGDLIVLNDGSTWLVVMPLENFYQTSGWTKIAVVRQQ